MRQNKKYVFLAIFAGAALSLIPGQAFAQDVQKAAEEAAQAIADAPKTQEAPPKPVYWTKELKTNLNFIQTGYHSWAKGGYNNYAMSAFVDGNFDYAKDQTYWKNHLNLKYGFLYSADKPIFQKNLDIMQFESTWGYKATKTINYTAKFTFLNQFAKGYNYPVPSVTEPTRADWKDARVLKSNFLSPAIVSLGLGVDWVPSKWLTVNFAPLTGGFKIVTDEQLRLNYGMTRLKEYADKTQYPDEKDEKGLLTMGNYYRKSMFELGSQLTADVKFKINDNIDLTSHLILFSNYLRKPQNLRVNWDNMLSWKLTQFFAMTFSTFLIYDDTVLVVDEKYPDGHKAVQWMETFNFGFTYTFPSAKKQK